MIDFVLLDRGRGINMHQQKQDFERDILFFDLEFYVPPIDRNNEEYIFKFNPCKKEHFIIGGTFTRYNPQKDRISDLQYENLWIWKFDNEKELLMAIYEYFKESWVNQQNKNRLELDVCGIGISKVDLPVLYIRCEMNNIDEPTNLFNIFFKSQHIELNNMAIPFFDEVEQFHPISINRIYRRFGIHKEKETGMTVWDMYDLRKFGEIKNRTNNEVKDCIIVFKLLTKEILKNKRFSSRKK